MGTVFHCNNRAAPRKACWGFTGRAALRSEDSAARLTGNALPRRAPLRRLRVTANRVVAGRILFFS